MRAIAIAHEFSDLGRSKRVSELHFEEPMSDKDMRLLMALGKAHEHFLSGYADALRRGGLAYLNRSFAIICGTNEIVPELVGPRRAVKVAVDDNIGDAALCARCGTFHLKEWIGTLVFTPENGQPRMPYVPIFVGMCASCSRVVFKR